MKWIYLNGMTCFNCRSNFYNGYNGDNTMPCSKCGDIQPARVKLTAFRKMIKERDKMKRMLFAPGS